MRIILFSAAFAASFGVFGQTAEAQSLRDHTGPAEYPPASYTGRQFVDSRGCMFVRAGVGTTITWVPRVTRQRQVICGQTPTFAQAIQPAEPRRSAASEPVEETSVPAATTETAAAQTPARTRRVRVAAPVETAASSLPPAPSEIQAVVPTPAPAATPRRIARVTSGPSAETRPMTNTCPNASDFSRRYINDGVRYPVRCYPQEVHPSDVVRGQNAGTGVSSRGFVVPEGYQAAWTDGRLNSQRGVGTAQGQVQMEQVWTNTVPRRLVTRPVATQRVAAFARDEETPIMVPSPSPDAADAPDVVVSTRSEATAAVASSSGNRAASHRYVQVGTYGDGANAIRAARRLQRVGLPVRIARVNREGQALEIVLAGPFERQSRLDRAMRRARRAGFNDAILRQ